MASHTDSRAGPLEAVNIAALVLALTVTALRCFVRIRLIRSFGVDDWLMAGAAMSFTFYCSFSLSGVANGTGRHVADLTKEANAAARKWWWLCYPAYSVTMVLTKLSIACFFHRVIVDRVHKWILWAAVAITLVSCTIFFFACIFQCSPVSYFWDKYSQTGTCMPDGVVIALGYLYSVVNIITDFTFALLPARMVSHLDLKPQTKVLLSILMGLGCVASAAVVARLPYVRFLASDDFLYETVDVAIWSTVEQGLAIIAGGLATLQPLVRLIAYKLGLRSGPGPSLARSGHGNNNNNNTNGNNTPRRELDRGTISVKRSITRTTQALTAAAEPKQYALVGVKVLRPYDSYMAMCYNTSEEVLRLPSAGSTGKTSTT